MSMVLVRYATIAIVCFCKCIRLTCGFYVQHDTMSGAIYSWNVSDLGNKPLLGLSMCCNSLKFECTNTTTISQMGAAE